LDRTGGEVVGINNQGGVVFSNTVELNSSDHGVNFRIRVGLDQLPDGSEVEFGQLNQALLLPLSIAPFQTTGYKQY